MQCDLKISINVFRGDSDWFHIVRCITKLQIHLAKPRNVTYTSLQKLNENTFKEDVSHIPFQKCNIFNDVSEQYWATNWLFTEVLNEHGPPLKERNIKID